MPKFDVVGIGVNAVDALFCLPEDYKVDHKNRTEDAKIQAGGPAGTASCVCAMLDWKVGFITPMGNDMLSGIATTELVSRGVSAELFVPYEHASPVFSVIQIDPRLATRTIFSQNQKYRVDAADVPIDAVRQARILLADNYEADAVMTALEAVQGISCRSVLDLEDGDSDWLWRAIELGTDIIMPFVAARKLTGAETPEEAVRQLAEKNTRAQLVVTNGMEGSWAFTPKGMYHQAAFQVHAKDTTGCGDVFHGAYAAGLLEGMSLEMRLEFAAWLASITATKVGGREALLSRHELLTQDLSMLSNALQAQLHSMAS